MLTLENVEANAAQPVDVGVVDLSQEAHFGRCHGVVVWKKELEFEDTACILLIYILLRPGMRLHKPS